MTLRRRKGDVVSYAENNTKGGVRMMGRQNPIKRTDVTTLLLLLLSCAIRASRCIVHGRLFCTDCAINRKHNKIAHPLDEGPTQRRIVRLF
jgi:hypothetical protein